MTDGTVLETLRRVEFLHDITDDHLTRLVELVRVVEFPAHATIFRENEIAKDLYVIVTGRVSLVICTAKVGCRQLMEVGDGEMIGWSTLVDRSRLSDTARTLTPTKALAIDGEQVLQLCQQDPQFGFEFMRRVANVLASRLSATRMQLLETGGFHLPNVQIESD